MTYKERLEAKFGEIIAQWLVEEIEKVESNQNTPYPSLEQTEA